MSLYRALGDRQLPRDLLIALAVADEHSDFTLALSELGKSPNAGALDRIFVSQSRAQFVQQALCYGPPYPQLALLDGHHQLLEKLWGDIALAAATRADLEQAQVRFVANGVRHGNE